jgi:hypothetical protein
MQDRGAVEVGHIANLDDGDVRGAADGRTRSGEPPLNCPSSCMSPRASHSPFRVPPRVRSDLLHAHCPSSRGGCPSNVDTRRGLGEALAECPRICFPFRSSWADARAQNAAECPGRAHWSSDSDAFTSGGIAPVVLRTGRCCMGSHAFRPRPQDAGTRSCGSTRSQSRSASRAHRRLAGRGGRRDGAFATGAVLLSRSSLLQRLQLHPSSESIAGEWSGKGHHHPRRTLTGTACRG